MKFACVIVEDEPILQDVIRTYIDRIGMLEVAGQFRKAVDAFTFMQTNKVDLMFLDIKMPQMTGLELLKAITQKPKVIITSAYRDFAFEAYDLDVVDYVLKPVSFERLLRAIGKAVNLDIEKAQAFANPSTTELREPPFIFIKGNKMLRKVYIDSILFIEAQGDYLKFKLAGQEDIVTRETITYYEQFLPSQQFLRVHRSFIVAIKKITAVEATRLQLESTTIPIGKNYRQSVTDFLKKYKNPAY